MLAGGAGACSRRCAARLRQNHCAVRSDADGTMKAEAVAVAGLRRDVVGGGTVERGVIAF